MDGSARSRQRKGKGSWRFCKSWAVRTPEEPGAHGGRAWLEDASYDFASGLVVIFTSSADFGESGGVLGAQWSGVFNAGAGDGFLRTQLFFGLRIFASL
jgi:hypothetical protein